MIREAGGRPYYASNHAPHIVRGNLVRALGMPETAVRVIAPDVGGGFGVKGGIYPEKVLVAWAARRLQRTVRWQADRAESLLADNNGREQDAEGEIALAAEGRILALRVPSDYNTGAHFSTGGGVSQMFAWALRMAADRVIEKGRAIADRLMEVAPDDVVFEDGVFAVAGTERKMRIPQVAALSFKPILPPHLGLGLAGRGDFLLQGFTFPNGRQIAEVEADAETGAIRILSLVSVDDVATVVNPMLLEGQMVGGTAKGFGRALIEDLVYDNGGQLLTGSFMDYAMPRADEIPPSAFETLATETKTKPLGVKGAGEAGAVGATPAAISAILDALSVVGADDIALPATPERVWRAIAGAR